MVHHPFPRAGLLGMGAALMLIGLGTPVSARSHRPVVAAAPAAGAVPEDHGSSPAAGTGAAASSSAVSESPGTPQVPAKLGLKQCLELALAHNADYKQSLVSVANADSRLRATRQLRHLAFNTDLQMGHSSDTGGSALSTFGPTLSLSQPNGAGLTTNATVPGYNSPDVGGQAGMEYMLPLLRGRGRGSQVRAQLVQAQIDSDTAKLQQFDNEQGLIQSVTQAYYDVLNAQDQLKVQQQAVDNAQAATTDAQKRLDAGLNTEIDVTRAKLQLSNTQVQLVQQQQSYHDALDALVLILGFPVGAQPELTDSVNYTYTPSDEAAAINTALERRPELGEIRLNKSNADVQLALAQSQRKPQADMHFNLSSVGFTLLGGAGLANVLTSLLGLHVQVPMKERPLQESVTQAERNRDILDDTYEFRRQKIVSEVRGLVRQAETSKANVDLLTENLDVAKKSEHIAQRMIDEGLADNRSLLDAQAALTLAESGLLSAKVRYFLTMVNLRRAMGLPLRDYFGLPPAADDGYYPRAHGELVLTRSPKSERAKQSRAQRADSAGPTAMNPVPGGQEP